MVEFKSVLKQIYDCLKNNGYDVYFPSQHEGECLDPYIEVKYDGTMELVGVSSDRPIYDILCYVPENNYSMLERMIFDIKVVLKALYPMIQQTGNETAAYYDEDLKAHMISVQYQGIRKLEYL